MKIGSFIKIAACLIMVILAILAIYQPGVERTSEPAAESSPHFADIHTCHFFMGFL